MNALKLYASYLDKKLGNKLAKEVTKNNTFLATTNRGSMRSAEIYQNLENIETNKDKFSE